MVQVGFNKPNNDVVQGNYLTEQLKVGANATPAAMLPGALVIRDVNDYDVQEADVDGTAGLAIGWLGYGMTNANYKPTTRDTAYAVGDYVSVHNGGNFRVRAIASTLTVVKGQPLEAGAGGIVVAGDADSYTTVAHAAESVTAADIVWVVSNI